MRDNIWSIGTKDFFTKKMLRYALVPFFGTIFVMYVLFFLIAGAGLETLKDASLVASATSEQSIDGVVTTSESNIIVDGGYGVLNFLFAHTVTSWLVSFFVFTVGGYAVFVLSMFIALVIVGFMTPYIVKEVKKRHYREFLDDDLDNSSGMFWTLFKHIGVALLLFVLLIPFYFIPLVNIIAFNIPFYYLFHKVYLSDVREQTLSQEEFKSIIAKKAYSIRFITLVLFMISAIPALALFTSVYNVIILTHKLLRERRTNATLSSHTPI